MSDDITGLYEAARDARKNPVDMRAAAESWNQFAGEGAAPWPDSAGVDVRMTVGGGGPAPEQPGVPGQGPAAEPAAAEPPVEEQQREPTDQPLPGEERAPGIRASLERAATAVRERSQHGRSEIEKAGLENTINVGGVRVLTPRGLARAAVGAVEATMPFQAAGGELLADLTEFLQGPEAAQLLTDENLQESLARAQKFEPGAAPFVERLLAMPYEERIRAAREDVKSIGESLASLIPGYTGAARLGAAAVKGGVGLVKAGRVAQAAVMGETGAVGAGAVRGAVAEFSDRAVFNGRRLGELLQPGDDVIIAKDAAGKDLGMLHVTTRPGGFEVRKIEVNPEARRQGVATALYEEANRKFGFHLGSTDQTPEGAALVRRLRETRPEIFGGPAPTTEILASGGPEAERAYAQIGRQIDETPELRDLVGTLADETGMGRPAVLARLGQAAAGALTGSYVGDTPEERFRNAAAGLFVGAAIPAQKVARLAQWSMKNAAKLVNPVRKATHRYPPEVAARMEALFKDYDAAVDVARRGTRPHAQAIAEAKAAIAAGEYSLDDVRALVPGTALNDTQATAMYYVVTKQGREVQAEAQRLLAASQSRPLAPDELNDFFTRLYEMKELLPRTLGVRAEAGRTLSALNDPTQGLVQYLNEWHQLFHDPELRMSPERLMGLLQRVQSPERFAKLAAETAKPGWSEFAIEAIYSSFLNPTSTIANALGGVTGIAAHLGERAAMAAAGDIARANELSAIVRGWVHGAGVAWQNAYQTWKTGESVLNMGPNKWETAYSEASRANAGFRPGITHEWLQQTWFGKIAETTVPLALGAAAHELGMPIHYAIAGAASLHPFSWVLVPRVLMATDEAARSIIYSAEKMATAVRRTAHIENPRLAKQKMLELYHNPPEAIHQAAMESANLYTLNAPPGPLMEKIIEGVNSPKVPGFHRVLLKTVVPFLNIPNNAMKFAGYRVPGLQQLSATWWTELTSPGQRQDRALGALALGGAWLAVVAGQAAAGRLTGSGPSDPNQRREWLADGNQEYAWNTDDASYSLNRADPWAQILGIVADWSAIAAHLDEATNDEIAGALLMTVSKDWASKSYLQGAAETGNALVSKNPGEVAAFIQRRIAGVGVPSVWRQWRMIEDPHIRATRNLVDKAMDRVPGVSQKLPADKNLFADPVMGNAPIGYGLAYFNIFTKRTKRNDPAIKAYLANDLSYRMPGWQIFGSPNREYTLEPTRETVGIPITGQQRDRLIDLIGKPLKKEWLAYVNSAEYDSKNLGPDSKNAKVFDTLYRAFATAGVQQLVAENKDLEHKYEILLNRRGGALTTPQGRRPAELLPTTDVGSSIQRLLGQ